MSDMKPLESARDKRFDSRFGGSLRAPFDA